MSVVQVVTRRRSTTPSRDGCALGESGVSDGLVVSQDAFEVVDGGLLQLEHAHERLHRSRVAEVFAGVAERAEAAAAQPLVEVGLGHPRRDRSLRGGPASGEVAGVGLGREPVRWAQPVLVAVVVPGRLDVADESCAERRDAGLDPLQA